MIPKETLRKIKRIQITTNRKVTDLFAGQYQSVFKGVGMEFDEVREYNPGDEIRSIDWNVTARMGHPFIKKFVEERELTIMLLLDVSMSCRYGTINRMKSDIAAEFCSVLAFSAIKNSDKVGMLTFTDKVEKYVPPRKGTKHVLRFVREALYNQPEGVGTDINNVLEYLNRVTSRRTITFIISDFYCDDFKKVLSITNKRHDVIAASSTVPSDMSLPDAGLVKIHDAVTGRKKTVDTSNPEVRKTYEKYSSELMGKNKKLFRSVCVDNIDIQTDKSYEVPLMRFFKMRERRIVRR